jgi:hypothetical protein
MLGFQNLIWCWVLGSGSPSTEHPGPSTICCNKQSIHMRFVLTKN